MSNQSQDANAFNLDRLSVPIGTMLVVTDDNGALRAIDWTEYESRMRRLLGRHYGEGRYTLRPGKMPKPVRAALSAYFGGDLAAIEALPVATGGTPFQRDVWKALRTIPPGETRSYSALATALGRPAAVRAVGLANGANPIGVVVPCHRVVGKSAALTGYAGGLERKRWLLAHEGVT